MVQPIPDSSRVPADSEMANPINTSWALLAAVLAAVLAVVLVAVLAAVLAGVLAVLNFVSYTRCDLILYVNVKPPLSLTQLAAAT